MRAERRWPPARVVRRRSRRFPCRSPYGMAMPSHVDVHAHYLPDSYREAAIAAGHSQPDGFPQLPEWNANAHVEMMDRLGIAVSMLSISSPGVHFGDDAAA